MSVYVYDESQNLSTHEIIKEIEARANPLISGDVIRVYGAAKQYPDIMRSIYILGHQITCNMLNYFEVRLKDTPGAYPDEAIWKQLQLRKNQQNCQVTDVHNCTFRLYMNCLPNHILFCATTRTYCDTVKHIYYREPDSHVQRRKSLRSNQLKEFSHKQFRRYQRKYCPWAIEDNDNMYK